MADIEKASNSNPSSPSSPSWTTSLGYVLDPAYGFPSQAEKRLSAQSYDKSLTPSSSRTSLSSTTSLSSNGTSLTKKARAELQDYYSSFDKTRAAKRRSSLR